MSAKVLVGSRIRRIWQLPTRLAMSTSSSGPSLEGGTLILLRSGESTISREGRFDGCIDCSLTDKSQLAGVLAGMRLSSSSVKLDVAFSGALKRAIKTCWQVLDQTDSVGISHKICWELNGRNLGVLQGALKGEASIRHGAEKLKLWMENSIDEKPPSVQSGQVKDRSDSESHQMVFDRVMDLWRASISPALSSGQNILVVGHRTSIAALIIQVEELSVVEMPKMVLPPPGIPLVYRFDASLRTLTPQKFRHATVIAPMKSGVLLADQKSVHRALRDYQDMVD